MIDPRSDEGDAFFDAAPCGYLAGLARWRDPPCQPHARGDDRTPRRPSWSDSRTFVSLLSVSGRIYARPTCHRCCSTDGTVRGCCARARARRRAPRPGPRQRHAGTGPEEPKRVAHRRLRRHRAAGLRTRAARRRSEPRRGVRSASTHARADAAADAHASVDSDVTGWSSPRSTGPPATARRSAATSTTSSRSATTTGSSLVGDVTGKGIHAATVTALARYTIRARRSDQPEPAAILTTVNDGPPPRRPHDRAGAPSPYVGSPTTAAAGRSRHATLATPSPLHLDAHADVTELGSPGTLLGPFDDRCAPSSRRLRPRRCHRDLHRRRQRSPLARGLLRRRPHSTHSPANSASPPTGSRTACSTG